jgi:hypothetical protein
MKNKKQPGKTENLYIQIWRNPIFYEGLLTMLSPVEWHTLTGLAVFMNEKGECNPSLERLCPILGLNNITSISRRIKALEGKNFNGNPILVVKRGKKPNEKGNWQFINNQYLLNPEVVSIFSPHPATLTCRKLRMEKYLKARQEFVNSFDMNSKRKKNNITKDIY